MERLKKLFGSVSQKWVEYAALLIAVAVLGHFGVIVPRPAALDTPVFVGLDQANRPAEVVHRAEDTDTYFGGWVASPDVAQRVRGELLQPWFSDTDAGKIAMGDDDVYLWKAATKVTGKNMEPRNQLQVGSCVSFGTAVPCDLLQLIAIANGANQDYKPVVQESIYGLSRVEIGGGRIRGDGSVGSWAAKAVQNYGVLPREVVGKYDLTTYSEQRCREWGQRGLPDELEPIARKSPVKTFAFCRTTQEVDRALTQGYPIAICSSLGVSQQRDANGFARWDRSWAHCMAIIGRRTDIPGYYVWNSWGANYHRGPLGVGEPPEGGFWLRQGDLARLLSDNNTECIAFSDAVGFPSRKLDWVVSRPQPKKGDADANVFRVVDRLLATAGR